MSAIDRQRHVGDRETERDGEGEWSIGENISFLDFYIIDQYINISVSKIDFINVLKYIALSVKVGEL